MKRATPNDRANASTRLAAYRKAQNQTKLDLINAARDAEEDDHWPQYLWPDVDDDAWFHRKYTVSELIEKRGRFSNHVTTLALTDSAWETKEVVAAWLRNELKVLRGAEAKPGTAPVRRSEALSRAVISDVAIELLESIAGESLICLFQELLDVDRHRKSVAEAFVQLDRAAEAEAQLGSSGREYRGSQVCQSYVGVAEHGYAMAKIFSISPTRRLSPKDMG